MKLARQAACALLLAATVTTATATDSCTATDGTCGEDNAYLSPGVAQLIKDLPTENSLYLNGVWVKPTPSRDHAIEVIDPSTGRKITEVAVASMLDVGMAVSTARRALEGWSLDTPLKERSLLVSELLQLYKKRVGDMAALISHEMGAPRDFAIEAQAASGTAVIEQFLQEVGPNGDFESISQLEDDEDTWIIHQAIGVAGLITPWNWPMHQITLKVIPALLVGCTVVLKPSEQAPLSALLFTQMIHDAGFPPGVFQLVNGYGTDHAGEWLASHSDVDMVSFTGSTLAGSKVALAAAPTTKRVSLEMGGKGANIIFDDLVEDEYDDHDIASYNEAMAEFESAVEDGVWAVMSNTGQSCDAPTRMLVPEEHYDFALETAEDVTRHIHAGSAHVDGDHIGPVVSGQQYRRIQGLIRSGIDEGARLLVGGLGKPRPETDTVNEHTLASQEHYDRGFYVRPTVFADCAPHMRIWREEIFGPVLCVAKFATEEEAVRLANDSAYGLTNYVHTYDDERRRRLAYKLRSGMVVFNDAPMSAGAPFGGVKWSGNGREGGVWGLEDFCVVKAVSGLKGYDL